ncbi:GSU2403 family nucleotidyltransferase fold protein [Isoptericola sp. b408]|uniref:GSU2403 family nucleotidyltransferase fold protein n=1 Tax=Isoptericola sp. b408 TaxID=3064653 RepID=UPI00271416A5|nr:GSU2403 family nucleotidyltransferase fold protein [Isoptericola sp. b408]MDO8152289.1 GSU2403 family nucleotidyltransferase fold protein [Isoptericola sp. b408]
MNGESPDLLVRSRSALLDAAEALGTQRGSVIVIGAQAVYLHTGSLRVALAEATKDSDVVLDPRLLHEDPLIEDAMKEAGFVPTDQPGSWVTSDGVLVDLMVPEALAGSGGRPGARIPPHGNRAARRAVGLEAALVDNHLMSVSALAADDPREVTLKVAGPAALMVAKMHKIAERLGGPRSSDKDAHDVYRLFRQFETDELTDPFTRLLADDVSAEVTELALQHVGSLLATGPEAEASVMAGRAEAGVGNPEEVSASVAFLAADLMEALGR